LVSILTISFFWRRFIENILPPGSYGIVAVIENTCGQSFTYQINGPDVVYMGPGDFHDDAFNDLEQIQRLTDLKKQYQQGETVSYTGFPLSKSFCPYTIRIYPSQEYEDTYLTSKPVTYTAVAVSIFLLTSAVFLLYDILVER
jgi:hypothetical protein